MKYYFLLIILLFPTAKLYCQTDSISVEEAKVDTLMRNDRIYKLFMEQSEEEIRHLFKLNIIGFTQLAPLLGFEQKIGRSFSSETSVGMGSSAKLDRATELYGFSIRSQTEYGFYVSGYQMFKYYHNLKRRERLGKNTNGFAGNYLAFQVGLIYLHDSEINLPLYSSEIYYVADVTYGVQRRIGNVGYIEPSVSLFLQEEHGSISMFPSINLEMGFAIDSFSNLERMLNK